MAHIEFKQESATINKLYNILEQEQLCLVEVQLEKLQDLLDQKSKTIQTLGALSQQRYKALASAGFSNNEVGMNAWVSEQKQSAIQAAWLSTQQVLVKAKELNRVNGLMINKQFNRNQQLLKALNGSDAEHQHVYGPNGQSTTQVRLGNAVVG